MKKIFLILIFLSGCTNDYVARIGSRKITENSFKSRMLDVPTYYRGFLETEGGRRQYLEGIVNESVLVELAEAKGIHRRPEVRERMDAMKDQILLESVVEDLKKDQLKVSDEEISEYYEQRREFYLHPPRASVSHILVGTKTEAQKIYNDIKAGASFSQMAKKHSIDRETAAQGGDLGYFEKGEMVPEFEEAAFALKETGDVSDVIKTAFGWHIIKLTGRSTATSKTKDDAREEIVQLLGKEKLDNLLQFYKKKFHVKVNYERIAGIYPPWHVPEKSEAKK